MTLVFYRLELSAGCRIWKNVRFLLLLTNKNRCKICSFDLNQILQRESDHVWITRIEMSYKPRPRNIRPGVSVAGFVRIAWFRQIFFNGTSDTTYENSDFWRFLWIGVICRECQLLGVENLGWIWRITTGHLHVYVRMACLLAGKKLIQRINHLCAL